MAKAICSCGDVDSCDEDAIAWCDICDLPFCADHGAIINSTIGETAQCDRRRRG